LDAVCVQQLQEIFSQNTFVGSMMVDARALLFTDSRIHDDGFGRMLITSKPYMADDMDDHLYDLAELSSDGNPDAKLSKEFHPSCMDQGMGPAQTGRVLQRILELESYRLMVLMGSPVVQVPSSSRLAPAPSIPARRFFVSPTSAREARVRDPNPNPNSPLHFPTRARSCTRAEGCMV